MTTTITLLYENLDDATFDLDYYMATHIPLVDEKFRPFGLKGWRVLKSIGTPLGGNARFKVIVTFDFDTADQFRAAMAAEGADILSDLPNFTNKEPLIEVCDVLGAA